MTTVGSGEQPEAFTKLPQMNELGCDLLRCDSHLPLILLVQLQVLNECVYKWCMSAYTCCQGKNVALVDLSQSYVQPVAYVDRNNVQDARERPETERLPH